MWKIVVLHKWLPLHTHTHIHTGHIISQICIALRNLRVQKEHRREREILTVQEGVHWTTWSSGSSMPSPQ